MRVSRRGVVKGLLVVLLGGAAVFGSIQLLGSEKVIYLAADAPGPNPFTEPAVFASANQRIAQVTTTTTTVAPDPSAGFLPVIPVPGAAAPEAPLVGASGECDRELLITMLNQSPERKAEWADVQIIPADDVETYIRSLSPSVLTRDTRVSYFGFQDGEAKETQAILASGTAVLINGNGEVVLRCFCGNPLNPPRKIKYNCEGCPDNFEPPPACNGTCYEAPTTTVTTLPVPTTLLETTTTTVAPSRTTVTRRAGASTTRRAPAGTTTTTLPPVNQTTGTLFPPNTGTFAPPAPSSAPSPGGGSSTTTTTSMPPCTGPLCGILP